MSTPGYLAFLFNAKILKLGAWRYKGPGIGRSFNSFKSKLEACRIVYSQRGTKARPGSASGHLEQLRRALGTAGAAAKASKRARQAARAEAPAQRKYTEPRPALPSRTRAQGGAPAAATPGARRRSLRRCGRRAGWCGGAWHARILPRMLRPPAPAPGRPQPSPLLSSALSLPPSFAPPAGRPTFRVREGA